MDRMKDRPGVPMEEPPRPKAAPPSLQPIPAVPITQAAQKPLTPVFSTANPPRGLSGLLRRAAYHVGEHKVRHWLILLLADRVDVVESLLLERVRRHPARALLALAGLSFLFGRGSR